MKNSDNSLMKSMYKVAKYSNGHRVPNNSDINEKEALQQQISVLLFSYRFQCKHQKTQKCNLEMADGSHRSPAPTGNQNRLVRRLLIS